MNFLLDMKTILVTLVVGHLFTVVLISSYWRNHSRDSTFNTFFLAKCIQAIAWLLVILRGGIPDLFTVSIANSLQFIGTALESIALLMLVNYSQKHVKKFYIGLTIVFIVSFHLILLLYNYEHIRIFCASIATFVLAIFPAFRLMREKSSTLLMRLMGILYYTVALTFLVRAIVALLSEQRMGLFTPGWIQTISFLSIFLVMLLGNIGFILILKERADAELIHMAYYDDLTQALNRRTFVSRSKQMLTTCSKERKNVSFILFDIDHFKKFNDNYGHDVGDRILQDLSQRINQSLDSDSLFGRYGGDEFAIFLTGLDQNESINKLEKMKQLIADAEIPGIPEKYSISIGVITLIPDHSTKLESLYVCCDKFLYQAKDNGRNSICYGEYEESLT